VDDIRQWLCANPVDCLYLLAEPEPETMRLAARNGFRFVDSRVTLESPIRAGSFTETPRIRPARAADISELRRIAGESHRDTRFYVDGNFSREACDELYRIWIEKAVNNPNGAAFVAVPDERPVGYISCSVTDSAGHIGLLAVDSACRGASLGSELVRQACAWMRSHGASSVKVPTQGANVPGLRLYEKCGFAISSVGLWYHRWAHDGPPE